MNRVLRHYVVFPMQTFHGELLELKRLETLVEQRNRELQVLQIAGLVINASLDVQDVLYATTREIANLLAVEACAVFDWHELENEIRLSTRYSQTPQPNYPTHYHLDDFVAAQRVLRDGLTQQMTINQVDLPIIEVIRIREAGLRTRLMLPLAFQEQIIGLLDVTDSHVERVFTEQEVLLAQLMANQASSAIANARLYSEVHQYLEELTTLNMISQTITSSLDLHTTLSVITQQVMQIIGVEAVSVALYDEATDELSFAAVTGGAEEFMRGVRLNVGQGIVGWVVQHDKPILVPDVNKDSRFFNQLDKQSNFTTRSIICVPLQSKGKTIGAIQAMNKKVGEFDHDDLRILNTIIGPASSAIVNARLFERSQQEIVERKRAEQALQEERALLAKRVEERTLDLRTVNLELARASRLKDEFLASMSHELRTPLTAILGLCELLVLKVHGPLLEKQHQTVISIEESGRHLLSLINDILDLSKIEAGKLDIEIGPVSVKGVCLASLQFVKQLALKKDINLHVSFDDSVSVIQADERRLKQILVNLLSNAVKFTPENGKVGLEVEGRPNEQMIAITVWDTGIGIDPIDLERIFEPFTQLDSSLSRQHAGTGLGLALVSQMVVMHEGDISVISEPGQGSRFQILLPWEHHQAALASTSHASKNSAIITDMEPKAEPNPQPPLILIAEDDRSISALFKDYLLAIGYRVQVAYDGRAALDMVKLAAPDLILMDIQMPEMSGLEAMIWLRKEPQFATIPIIVLTAQAMSGDRERFLKAGANEYLSKPINLAQMSRAIEKHLAIMNGATHAETS